MTDIDFEKLIRELERKFPSFGQKQKETEEAVMDGSKRFVYYDDILSLQDQEEYIRWREKLYEKAKRGELTEEEVAFLSF